MLNDYYTDTRYPDIWDYDRFDNKKLAFQALKLAEEILEFVEKQFREEEARYALYFIYSGARGRVYVLRFTDKIRIVTVYPLGRTTLKNYNRGKFKK